MNTKKPLLQLGSDYLTKVCAGCAKPFSDYRSIAEMNRAFCLGEKALCDQCHTRSVILEEPVTLDDETGEPLGFSEWLKKMKIKP